jgi:hypothetical protein
MRYVKEKGGGFANFVVSIRKFAQACRKGYDSMSKYKERRFEFK